MPSNGATLWMLYIVMLTYIFKVTDFEMWISRKLWELAKNAQVWLYQGWYLPTKETIANVVLHDIYLNFQVQTFQVAILTSKPYKIQTLLMPSARKSGVCHLLELLQILYIMTLTYIFKFTNFEIWISLKWRKMAKMLR